MADIGIYCRKEVFDHKRRDGKGSEGMECYWEFAQLPDIRVGEWFWFAFEGQWRGFFVVKDVSDVVTFDSESWHPLGNAGDIRKPFQGFTYNVPFHSNRTQDKGEK